MSNQGPEVVINGVTYKNLNEAVYAGVHLKHQSKREDGTIPAEVQDKLDELDAAVHAEDERLRNLPAPDGQEKKTYTQVKGYDELYDVSHTYDSKGVKVRVGDVVTYKTGHTYYRITDIRWWMGRESISIERQSSRKGYTGQRHSFVGSDQIHAL